MAADPPPAPRPSASALPAKVGVPAISLPKGGGAIRGIGETFQANPVTGTATMSVPVSISPGRSGFGPQLALSYDSGAGNGPFGLGWGLGLPAIARKTDLGLPRYFDAQESDTFQLTGADDLVPALRSGAGGGWEVHEDTVDGYRVRRYRPRIEGLFARIERWTSVDDAAEVFWRSISRDNTATLYGADAAARIADPADPSRIFSWLICQTIDDKGNAVRYDYVGEDQRGVDLAAGHERNRVRTANRYLKRIRYGNRVPLLLDDPAASRPAPQDAPLPAQWLFEVVLDYGDHDDAAPAPAPDRPWPVRRDAFSSYRAGFEVRTQRRCSRILMFHHVPEDPAVGMDCLVRSTDLTYDEESTYSTLRSVTHVGYRRSGGGYSSAGPPPLELTYSRAEVVDDLLEADLPLPGTDAQSTRWLDLHGDGLPGLLIEQQSAWYFARNRSPLTGRAAFAVPQPVPARPNATFAEGAELLDLAGDGLPDLVMFAGATPGLYEHDGRAGWGPLQPFRWRPNRDTADPDVTFVDLDGDGRADVLITGDDALQWHASLGEEGFGPAERVRYAADEELGPRVVLSSSTELVALADCSGDGLADLVRIRNGEVCYWPNLGYGRFGAKVAMDHAPRFDHPDGFDPRRLRLADIDGSGTTDIIDLHRDGVRLFFNQCGNGFGEASRLHSLPAIDDPAAVSTADLLGNGTTCLVWAPQLPQDPRTPLRYIDLMGGRKPHLLIGSDNAMGGQVHIDYAPSTRFCLADAEQGRPWATRLPFPVQVVERTTISDAISRTRFTTRYAYHHGCFDGAEREFRGFAMVEQWDTEDYEVLAGAGPAENIDEASYVPPVLTRTWFHTGAVSARSLAHEYFSEPGGADLPDTVLPDGLTLAERSEAARALKGSLLRQEVYGLDAGPGASPQAVRRAATPYSVTEQNLAVRLLQPRAGTRNAVFLVHPREALTFHYERDPADPRVEHSLILDTDEYGTVLLQASAAYGRRAVIRAADGSDIANPALAALHPADRAKQTATLLTATRYRTTNAVDLPGDHRTPAVCEATTWELTGIVPTGPGGRFLARDLAVGEPGEVRLIDTGEVGYEQAPTAGPCRRPIEVVRTLFRADDLSALLPLGSQPHRALPGEGYTLALTAAVIADALRREGTALLPDPAAVLAGTGADRGGYLSGALLQADGRFPTTDRADDWWIPDGRSFFSPEPAAPAAEFEQARRHFFRVRRFRDPFGSEVRVDDDAVDLFATTTTDALGNQVRVLAHDYRVLQPRLVADPNGNRTEVAFDTFGLVVGTAVMGKPAPAPAEGDSLAGFVPDLSPAQLEAFFADPAAAAGALVQGAGTRFVYDLHRFRRSRAAHPADPQRWQPAAFAALARETHIHGPVPPHGLRIRASFTYADGAGRHSQSKLPAEPGPGGVPRWVGSGWTVLNNKGLPVREYEPFFSDSHTYEPEVQTGVSARIWYDPLGRAVATLHPDGTYDKVVVGAWQVATHDTNDTCTSDPRTDPDIAGLVAGYAATLPGGWATWHDQRIAGALGPAEQAAAAGAAAHAGTPSTACFDPLGRTFLTLVGNRVASPGHDLDGTETTLAERADIDIEGNVRLTRDAVTATALGGDPLGRVVHRTTYDMVGRPIASTGMDAGAQWLLADALGNPIRSWDSRGHNLITSYDVLRRRTSQQVRGSTPASDPRTLAAPLLTDLIEYGESVPGAEAWNLRTRAFRHRDTAGELVFARLGPDGRPVAAYDAKGNQLGFTRRLLRDAAALPDWAAAPALEEEAFTGSTRFDALNRPVQAVVPHSTRAATRSVVQPRYNEANLLEAVEVWLDRPADPAGFLDPAAETPAPVGVTGIDYDARGQRLRIDYANGTVTTYAYDPLSLRLTALVTRRGPGFPGDDPQPPPTGWPGRHLQQLRYSYDPVGNVVGVRDESQQAVFFANARVEPSASFTYDALYRLVSATGREHLGQAGSPLPHSPGDSGRVGLRSGDPSGRFAPNDAAAMAAYVERYVYDAASNIVRMQHVGAAGGWTRHYDYLEPSRLDGFAPRPAGNRLSATRVGANGPAEPYAHDAHGNLVAMPHLAGMDWDFADQLRRIDLGGGGTVDYVYDGEGERIRKVWHKGAMVEERLWIGGFEVFRRRQGQDLVLERETLHIMDDTKRIAVVETRTAGVDPAPARLVRYQLGNHLGSAAVELDEQARIISYEEYSPYGSTTYQAVRNQTETPKRYRYAGKERDEESGLYYHGARYYAAWLGRWTACDPAGTAHGPNLYEYVNSRPLTLVDPTGTEGKKPPVNDPKDVATFEAREAAFEAGKKLEQGQVKATRGGRELPPPTGPQLDKITGNSKRAKELRLKYGTKQGIEASSALKNNVTSRSAAAAAGSKDVPHFGEASQKLVPEVGFDKGKTISVGKNPGGEPKGARTSDLAIAKEPTSPSQWDDLVGKKGSSVFEEATDLKMGGGRVPDKAGFKKASGGLKPTELTPGTKGLKLKKAPKGKKGGVIVSALIAGYVLFDSGDAWAAAQSINPISNTVDNALSGQANLTNSAKAIAKDVYNVTPVALLDWVVFDVMGPSGKEFRYDPVLAERARKEGRNSFCAQCHGPGGALDPNNAWNQQARLKQFDQSWNSTDNQAIIKWLETAPR